MSWFPPLLFMSYLRLEFPCASEIYEVASFDFFFNRYTGGGRQLIRDFETKPKKFY